MLKPIVPKLRFDLSFRLRDHRKTGPREPETDRCALARIFLQISFCMNEIENVEDIMVSHFWSKDQNNARNVQSHMSAQRKDVWSFDKASIKRNRHAVVLLHRELHLGLNLHIWHGRALKNI